MARIQNKATELQKKLAKSSTTISFKLQGYTTTKQHHFFSNYVKEKMLHWFLEIWRKSNSPTPCKSVPRFPLGGYTTQGIEPHLENGTHLFKNNLNFCSKTTLLSYLILGLQIQHKLNTNVAARMYCIYVTLDWYVGKLDFCLI